MIQPTGKVPDLIEDRLFMLAENRHSCSGIIYSLGLMDGHRLRLVLEKALQCLRSEGRHVSSKQRRHFLTYELRAARFAEIASGRAVCRCCDTGITNIGFARPFCG